MHRSMLLLAFQFAVVPIAIAGLRWDATEIETKSDAEKPEAEFTFTNTGDKPVQIVAAAPACECTKTEFDPAPVPPGGKGKITAIFSPGQRSGLQTLQIAAWTDVTEDKPTLLRWRVQLPDVLSLKPSVLAWKEGEFDQLRTLEVAFPNAPQTRILTATADDPAFTAKIEGNRVHVRIAGSPVLNVSMLRLETDSRLKRLKEIQAPLSVAAEEEQEPHD